LPQSANCVNNALKKPNKYKTTTTKQKKRKKRDGKLLLLKYEVWLKLNKSTCIVCKEKVEKEKCTVWLKLKKGVSTT